jgi:type VI protein secretion system component Hcp
MKKIYIVLLLVAIGYCGLAQTAVYARFITYNSQVLKTDGSVGSGSLITATSIDPSNLEFFKLTTFTQGVEQVLNIGSQSTGAGAGKIGFNPFTFSRPADGASPAFFQNAASGTPYRTIEVFFTDPSNKIAVKQLYKLAAIKTVNWAAASCSADCPGVIENISVEYGGQIVTVYKSGATTLSTPIVKGWNRVKNISDNDPTVIIQ